MRIALLAFLIAGCTSSGLIEHPPSGALDSIVWMQGTWRTPLGQTVTEEIWVPTSEHSWMGLNRVLEPDGSARVEHLRLEVLGAGVRYTAAPPSQSTTHFALVSGDATEARFENPDHDFPNWIRYAISGRAMRASIGGTGSDEPAAEWAFRRYGDAPALLDVAGRLCRDGSTLRVTLEPRYCGAQIFCHGFSTAEGIDLHLAISDQECDACVEAVGTCEVEGAVTRVNGRAVEEVDGCVEGSVPVLLLSN